MQRAAGTLQGMVWRQVCRRAKLLRMSAKIKIAIVVGLLLIATAAFNQTATAPADVPQYTADGQMKRPENYRQWVYLSTGFNMSYSPAAQAGGMDMFDNVFVNPSAYRAFLQTGTWPDKTMFALEVRGAESKGSINQHGHFQSEDLMGLEVHVKDEARFPGKWAFFGFDNNPTAKMIPKEASCYSCHAAHGAVDTTFVQFYPTLLPIAKAKGTLSAGYVKESEGK